MNVELFPCSGGFAEGFRRAGIVFDLAIEKDTDACDSYEKNHGHRPVQMDALDFLRMVRAGWRPPGGVVDFLCADPPCTPWSRAGKREGLDDPRDCLAATAELIALLRPRAYLIGNVPGLQDSTSWGVVQKVIGGLAREGYCVKDYASLDAADYGSLILCPEHAPFAEKFSIPTHVMGCVTLTGRSALPMGATPADRPSISRPKEKRAGAASQDGRAEEASTRAAHSIETGPADDIGKPATDMCACGAPVDLDAENIGSSPRPSWDARSDWAKSFTTSTRTSETMHQRISGSSQASRLTEGSMSPATLLAECSLCRHTATPQHRIRPFWFGHRDGPCIRWPAPTHAAPTAQLALGAAALLPWVTCRQALQHLSLEELGRPVRMKIRDAGEDGTKHGGDATRCSAPDKVATTVMARQHRKGGQIMITGAEPTPPAGKKRWLPNGGDESLCSAPDKPASTVGAHEGIKGGQILLVDGHPAAREDAPAPTIRGGGAGHSAPQSVLLLHDKHPMIRIDEPAMTVTAHLGATGAAQDRPVDVVTTDPARVGAGPGQTLTWPWDRPADERLSVPGHHDATVGNSSHKGPNAVVLSERAAAILQGFPEGWTFAGATKRARWSQIGQAMPPPLAHAVAESATEQMSAARATTSGAASARGGGLMARRELSLRQRFEILKRDHFTCVYCGARPPAVELAVDHVRSCANGGSNEPNNLITACVPCNQGKREKNVECCLSCARPLCRGPSNPRDDLEARCGCNCHGAPQDACPHCLAVDCSGAESTGVCSDSIVGREEMFHDIGVEESFE